MTKTDDIGNLPSRIRIRLGDAVRMGPSFPKRRMHATAALSLQQRGMLHSFAGRWVVDEQWRRAYQDYYLPPERPIRSRQRTA